MKAERDGAYLRVKFDDVEHSWSKGCEHATVEFNVEDARALISILTDYVRAHGGPARNTQHDQL